MPKVFKKIFLKVLETFQDSESKLFDHIYSAKFSLWQKTCIKLNKVYNINTITGT